MILNKMPNKDLSTSIPVAGPLSAETSNLRDILNQFRIHLQQIYQSEIVRSDKQAQQIILNMLYCRNMAEVNAQVDLLTIRVGQLLAAKTGNKAELNRLITQARERGRAALTRNSKYHNFRDESETEQSARVLIKF
jgi:hypothetical protein